MTNSCKTDKKKTTVSRITNVSNRTTKNYKQDYKILINTLTCQVVFNDSFALSGSKLLIILTLILTAAQAS